MNTAPEAAGTVNYENWKEADGTSVYAFTYDYDQNGNRIAASILGVATYWEYDDADALTTKWTEPAPSEASYYTYDADGNLTTLIDEPSGSITYFEHGSHGLITKIKPLGGTEVAFAYDGLLRRIRMSEGAVHTYFRHDGINLIEIAKSDGTLTKVAHGYAPVPGIGSGVEIEINGTRYYFVQDDRGTIYKIIDSAGNVIWSAWCDAWGVPLSETGTNPTIFWYQGQAWIKLIINGRTYYVSPTRIYDPEDGRFVQRDPLLRSDGTSAYGYIQNQPLMFLDPTGSQTELEPAHLQQLYMFLLEELIRMGVSNWDPSKDYHKNGLSVEERAAQYCGAGIKQSVLIKVVGRIGVEAAKSTFKAARLLLPGGVYKAIKKAAKKGGKEILRRARRKAEQALEKALAKKDVISKTSQRTDSCFCEMTMVYDPATEKILGMIVGKVGKYVSEKGATDCCYPESFFLGFRADADIEVHKQLFLEWKSVEGVENLSWV